MPSFITRIFSRARVAENKFSSTGPVYEYNPADDMVTRAQLVPLVDIKDSKAIRLRNANIGVQEVEPELGIWEAFDDNASYWDKYKQPATLGLGVPSACHQRSISGCSTATAVSAGSCDSGNTLVPETVDNTACQKKDSEKNVDDSIANIDQDALFDEIFALCNPDQEVPISQDALFTELELLCAEPAPVPVAVKGKTSKSARRQGHMGNAAYGYF